MNTPKTELISFSIHSKDDKKLLKEFVRFHWDLYKDDPQYIPLLNYEYLGFRLIGMTGYFEADNPFLAHAEVRLFLTKAGGVVTGRCCAFTNSRHNEHWQDKTGFFGQFECINDAETARILLSAAGQWLASKGLTSIRGPQNFPINEATPGLLTDGFSSRSVIYYNYSKPYYADLLKASGFTPGMRIYSWEVDAKNPMEEKLERIGRLAEKRHNVTLETWDERPFDVRQREMLEIYNEAWSDNYGFVPFTEKEFSKILKDMLLIIDKNLFVFAYVKDEPAAMFGGVPNIFERMVPKGLSGRIELLRAAKMFLTARKVKGFRLGYFAVRKKYRNLGIEALLLWKQKIYTQKKGYEYCDIGWILETNDATIKLVNMMDDAKLSKTYTIFEKPLI